MALSSLIWGILANAIWLAYIFALFYLKGKVKLPKWIIFVGAFFLIFIWMDSVDGYQRKKEIASIDPALRAYFTQKADHLYTSLYSLNSLDSLNSLNRDSLTYPQDLELKGKFLGVSRDADLAKTELEFRLNDELKKHDQYTTNKDSLDYIVVALTYWETDSYERGATCSTEMADVFVIDYKTDSIVKKAKLDANKNPFAITSNSRYGTPHNTIPLGGEELYDAVFNSAPQESY